MRKPKFQKPSGMHDILAEDQSFFQRLQKLEIKAYLAPKVQCWHLKATRITEKNVNIQGYGKNSSLVNGFN